MKTDTRNYRPDVDGLRALAIIPVVCYHADLGFGGGFVGVDVFFVISGFLITSLIQRELEVGVFSLAGFWVRRICRLFPAMTVTLCLTLLAAWWLFLPEDLASLGKSMAAQAGLLANVHFYRQGLVDGGYFGTGTECRALLHTWSLAVEEQFYIFFPVLLLALRKLAPRKLRVIVILLTILSFISSLIALKYSPSAAFYLLPFRAWELLLGAALALGVLGVPSGSADREVSGIIGLVFILGSALCYHPQMSFPGMAALLPCLGAVMIIRSSQGRTSLVGRLFSFPPIVYIGLISYSLYLVHWPALTLVRYCSDGRSDTLTHIICVLGCVLLSALSLRFIERPFRRRSLASPSRGPLMWASGISVLAMCIGLSLYWGQGFTWRFNHKEQRWLAAKSRHLYREQIPLERALAGEFSKLGETQGHPPDSLLIWGDSHAMAVAPVINLLCTQYQRPGVLAAFHATAPLIGYTSNSPYALGENSIPVADSVMRLVKAKRIHDVVLVASWTSRHLYPADDDFGRQLLATIYALRQAGARVWLMETVPDYSFDVIRQGMLSRRLNRDIETMGHTPDEFALRDEFEPLLRVQLLAAGARMLDPKPYLLNNSGHYALIKDGVPLYFDKGHLNIDGAMLLKPLFEPIFNLPE